MKFFQYLLSFQLILLGFSCTKEIPLKTEFQPQIFISGYMLNYADTIYIDIQKTVPVNSPTINVINDARVTLYAKAKTGEISVLTSDFIVSNGIYKSNGKISPTIGNYYWMETVMPDGTTFKSDSELLKDSVPIKDIKQVNNFTKIIFNDPEEYTNFYLAYFAFYENGKLVSRQYALSSDALYNGNENAFIEIENTASKQIYCNILNLNFKTYQFYKNSFSQFEAHHDTDPDDGDPGRLFTAPPSNLTGNITNISTNRTALGFFGVFSYSEYWVDLTNQKN